MDVKNFYPKNKLLYIVGILLMTSLLYEIWVIPSESIYIRLSTSVIFLVLILFLIGFLSYKIVIGQGTLKEYFLFKLILVVNINDIASVDYYLPEAFIKGFSSWFINGNFKSGHRFPIVAVQDSMLDELISINPSIIIDQHLFGMLSGHGNSKEKDE